MSDVDPPWHGEQQGGAAQPPQQPYQQPYPQQPYPQQAYQQPYQPYAQPGFVASPTHGRATTSMVLGICALASFLICGLIAIVLGPIAFFIGRSAQKEIASQPGVYSNAGQAKAGWIMGLISTILAVVTTVLLVAYFVWIWNDIDTASAFAAPR